MVKMTDGLGGDVDNGDHHGGDDDSGGGSRWCWSRKMVKMTDVEDHDGDHDGVEDD